MSIKTDALPTRWLLRLGTEQDGAGRRTEINMPIISAVDAKCSPDDPRAEAAREWFALHGPPDMQPLPLEYGERERLKDGTPHHILAWYARSLALQCYDFLTHPLFYDYACGVMESEFAPDFTMMPASGTMRGPDQESLSGHSVSMRPTRPAPPTTP